LASGASLLCIRRQIKPCQVYASQGQQAEQRCSAGKFRYRIFDQRLKIEHYCSVDYPK
jgi:hypothetical protein